MYGRYCLVYYPSRALVLLLLYNYGNGGSKCGNMVGVGVRFAIYPSEKHLELVSTDFAKIVFRIFFCRFYFQHFWNQITEFVEIWLSDFLTIRPPEFLQIWPSEFLQILRRGFLQIYVTYKRLVKGVPLHIKCVSTARWIPSQILHKPHFFTNWKLFTYHFNFFHIILIATRVKKLVSLGILTL